MQRTALTRRSLSFLRSNASAMPSVSVAEEFPNLPSLSPEVRENEKAVSATAKGLRLASSSAAPVTTLGVFVNAGSRHESNVNSGVSLLASKMAFRSTEHRSDLRLYRDIEEIGGSVCSYASREGVQMNITVLPEFAEKAAEILAESLLQPKFAEWDVSTQKGKALVDIEEHSQNQVELLEEGIHAAAFYDTKTLGCSVYNKDSLANLNSSHVKKYHQDHIHTGSVALTGRGIDHAHLKDLANKYFTEIRTGSPVCTSEVKYIGGEYRLRAKSPLTYVSLAFNGASSNSQDKYVAGVLNRLLNIRASSSNTAAFNAQYSDAGLFGVSGFAKGSEAAQLTNYLIDLLKNASSVSSDELAAAKNAVWFSEYVSSPKGAMQTLGWNAIKQSIAKESEELAKFNAVSSQDIAAFAGKLISSTPSFAAVGDLNNVPRYDEVANKLQ